jgi:hypothetical protein
MQINLKDINTISYRRVVGGSVNVDGINYLPPAGLVIRESEAVKITFVSPPGVTMHGKRFLRDGKDRYWFENLA